MVLIPFEINEQSDVALSKIDPDRQLCIRTNYIKNLKCRLCIEDTVRKIYSNTGNQYENCFPHLIKKSSLEWKVCHYDALTEYLNFFKWWVVFESQKTGYNNADIPGYPAVNTTAGKAVWVFVSGGL